jgi:hypothetical protein
MRTKSRNARTSVGDFKIGWGENSSNKIEFETFVFVCKTRENLKVNPRNLSKLFKLHCTFRSTLFPSFFHGKLRYKELF